MLMDVAWKKSENDLLRERQLLSFTFSAYRCHLSHKKGNLRGGFQLPLLGCREKGETERAQRYSEWRAPCHLEHQSQQFFKMYEWLDVLPVAHISVCLSLSLCGDENHIWSNLITELGHDLRNVPHTTAGTHTTHAHATHSAPLCQLSLWPASSSTVAN